MSEDGARFDARFDDREPFRDTPDAGGISLESALHDYGPAAIDDLIPRLRALATLLDSAHRKGAVHGALHPSKVFVTDRATSLVKGTISSAPYVAPEVADGGSPTPASDLFSLAAITYEWLFGRRIDGPAFRTVDVKPMPGIDRSSLARAFSRALAPAPEVRFATCAEFCDAVAAATTPELPLLAADDLDEVADDEDDVDPVGPFIPEAPETAAPEVDDMAIVPDEPNDADSFESPGVVPLRAEDGEPDIDMIDPAAAKIEPSPVPAWSPPTRPPAEAQRFGAFALIFATIVGALFGFAAGYMARPRALDHPTAEFAKPEAPLAGATGATGATRATGATGAAGATGAPSARGEASRPNAPATPDARVAPAAPVARVTPAAPASGRLLVRSTPGGATVSVDGVEKGSTPLALGDVQFGTHNIVVTRSGYVSQSLRVVLSASRPSRSLDVSLAASAPAAAARRGDSVPRPSTPATLGKPAATTGSLNVDSRPAGASVSINGKPSGVTPLTINDLAPGDYQIQLSRPGYRNFTTTVRVVAGERARAAYSLTAQEQE